MSISEALIGSTFTEAAFLIRDYFLIFTIGCKRSPLQEKVNQLAKKMDVDIPIRVVENDRWAWAAHGTVFYGKGVITVPKKTDLDTDCVTAILTHEIAHIKHNDGFWFCTIAIITSVALSILLPLALPGTLLKTFIMLACISHYSETQEGQADDEALIYLNDKEKKALGDHFEKMRQENLSWRNEEGLATWKSILRKCYVNPDGDSLIGRFTHPTLISRVEKFRQQL